MAPAKKCASGISTSDPGGIEKVEFSDKNIKAEGITGHGLLLIGIMVLAIAVLAFLSFLVLMAKESKAAKSNSFRTTVQTRYHSGA